MNVIKTEKVFVSLETKLKDNVSVSFPHLLAPWLNFGLTTTTLSVPFHKWVKLRANSAVMQVSFPSPTVKLYTTGTSGTGAAVVTGADVVGGAVVVVFGFKVVVGTVVVVVVGTVVVVDGITVVVPFGSFAIA